MKKFLLAICLVLMLVIPAKALPPVPMGWGMDDRLECTADATISTIQVYANKYITNQGATGEVDLVLPAVSWSITLYFIVEEAQVIEVNPPTGEAPDLDGTTLDANDCVDSDSTVGSKIAATRMKNAAGTWIWSLDTIRGNWTDTGASD